MAQNEKGTAEGFGQRVAPARARTSSGMQLSVPPPLPPSMLNAPRRTLVGITAQSPRGFLLPLSPPARASASVDAAWEDEDENEDDVTDVYADKPTLIFEKRAMRDDENETTRELPGYAIRRTPVRAPAAPAAPVGPKAALIGLTVSKPPFPAPPPLRPSAFPRPALPPTGLGSLPPWGSAVLSASIPAASLPLPGAGTPRVGDARTSPPRLGVWSPRLAAALAAAGVLGLVVFGRMPGQGKILVDARDSRGGAVSHLDVLVDGERSPCATVPCYVPFRAGVHEVKVAAEGFEVPAPQAVSVTSGASTAINFILGSSSESGFKVSGSQEGVMLVVDDKEIGPLPQVLSDLVPGDHTIRLAGSDRYQPIARHVIVERDKVEDLGTITLKVLKGKANISLGTPGARVFVVSGADRRELPVLPISVDIDTSKPWSLEATKDGYRDYLQPIAFDDGKADKTYTVALEPKSTAAATYDPAPRPSLPAYPAPAPKAAPPRAGGAPRDGYLNINSIPASTCFLDGKSLGSTPRLRVSVSAGSHTVKFRDPDRGLTKSLVVNVGVGETKLAAARLN